MQDERVSFIAGKPCSHSLAPADPDQRKKTIACGESWLKACAIRIASLPAKDRWPETGLHDPLGRFNNNNGDSDVRCYPSSCTHSIRPPRASRSALTCPVRLNLAAPRLEYFPC